MAPRGHIENQEQYDALRDKGMSKEKSARIANSDSHLTGKKGGSHKKYEKWTKKELYEKASEVDIDGRSKMNKAELIHSLRNN